MSLLIPYGVLGVGIVASVFNSSAAPYGAIELVKRILFIFLLVLCLCAVPVSAAALGKVSGVKAKQSGEKVKVTWNTAAGAKGYQVYQKTGSEKFHRI